MASPAPWPRTAASICCTCASARPSPTRPSAPSPGSSCTRSCPRAACGACSPTQPLAWPACPTGSHAGSRASWRRRRRALADEPDRGRVIADGPIAAAALGRLARRRPVIYNAHNLESGFRDELERRRRSQHAAHCGVRARAARARGESWMVSEADLAGRPRAVPRARKLRYVPNVVDVAAITPVSPDVERAAGDVRGELRLRAQPQRPALPARGGLPAGLGGAAGRAPRAGRRRAWSSRPAATPACEALGFVEDLRGRIRASVVRGRPAAAGRRNSPLKLIEALAYGLPVIATPRAAAGLARARRRALPDRGRRPRRSPPRSCASCARARRSWAAAAASSSSASYSIEALSALLTP